MHILVYDPDFRGHHLKYAAMVIEAFCAQGWQVTYATPEQALSSDEYRELLMPLADTFRKLTFKLSPCGYQSKLSEATEHTRRLIQMIRICDPDVVVIPHLDLCFYVYGIVGSLLRLIWRRKLIITGIQFAAIWAYEEAHMNIAKKLKKWIALYVVNLGPFSRILCIDENAFRWFTRARKLTRVEVGLCPDPVESDINMSVESCRDYFGIPRQARVIAAVGVLDERKGTDILVRAFSRMHHDSDQCLFLVGRQKPKVQQTIQEVLSTRPEVANTIIQVNRFVSTDEFRMAIKAADVICALYPCHCASASIVLRAAAARKPVLGSSQGWIGRIVKKYRIGRTCNLRDAEELQRDLKWAFNRPVFEVNQADRLALLNSIDSFKEKVCWLVPENCCHGE